LNKTPCQILGQCSVKCGQGNCKDNNIDGLFRDSLNSRINDVDICFCLTITHYSSCRTIYLNVVCTTFITFCVNISIHMVLHIKQNGNNRRALWNTSKCLRLNTCDKYVDCHQMLIIVYLQRRLYSQMPERVT